MSALHLNAIVTRALIDPEFRAAVLNGQRRTRLTPFDLTDQERAAVLAIEARDLDQFIRQVEAWMQTSERPAAGNQRSPSLAPATATGQPPVTSARLLLPG